MQRRLIKAKNSIKYILQETEKHLLDLQQLDTAKPKESKKLAVQELCKLAQKIKVASALEIN